MSTLEAKKISSAFSSRIHDYDETTTEKYNQDGTSQAAQPRFTFLRQPINWVALCPIWALHFLMSDPAMPTCPPLDVDKCSGWTLNLHFGLGWTALITLRIYYQSLPPIGMQIKMQMSWGRTGWHEVNIQIAWAWNHNQCWIAVAAREKEAAALLGHISEILKLPRFCTLHKIYLIYLLPHWH